MVCSNQPDGHLFPSSMSSLHIQVNCLHLDHLQIRELFPTITTDRFINVNHFRLFTARNRSFRRLCFYRCLSVGGACMVGGPAWQGACMAGGMRGRGHAWQEVCMAGACVVWGVCGGGHAYQILRDTVIRCLYLFIICIFSLPLRQSLNQSHLFSWT